MTMLLLEAYFDWLYRQCFRIRDLESPLSYSMVCKIMHDTEFTPLVPNDENREHDGRELRDEFVDLLNGRTAASRREIHSLGNASVFEVLVALSRRANFIAGIGPDQWFRTFLSNLGLLKYSDEAYDPRDSLEIIHILEKFNRRAYTRNGRGGIFPLRKARDDQRQIEIWYQMSAYMKENSMY